jgi:hypothetical protein
MKLLMRHNFVKYKMIDFKIIKELQSFRDSNHWLEDTTFKGDAYGRNWTTRW